MWVAKQYDDGKKGRDRLEAATQYFMYASTDKPLYLISLLLKVSQDADGLDYLLLCCSHFSTCINKVFYVAKLSQPPA
jgi:hypothetical protein